jgi:hypothetical protein
MGSTATGIGAVFNDDGMSKKSSYDDF